MKKTTSTLLFLLFSVFIFAAKPKVIENPSYELKNTGIFNVAKIVLDDTSTRVYIHITFLPKWWVLLNQKDIYIKDSNSEKSFSAIGIEGAEFDKKLWMPKSGDSTIVLIFHKLDDSIKKIDFITYSESAEGETIFGLSLINKKNNSIKDIAAIPEQVTKWFNNNLAKVTQKPLVDFNSPLFFCPDTAHLIGFIKGYDPRLNFSTGIIYTSNQITREDYPTVIRIYPDGRFEANFLLIHPIYSYFVINDAIIRFYLEPGQTLSVTLNWDEFLIADRLRNIRYQMKGIVFGGALAKINDELVKYPKEESNYKEYQKKVATLSPEAFKKDQLLNITEKNKKLETYAKVNPLTPQTYTILKNEFLLENSTKLLDFINDRSYLLMGKKDTANEIIKLPIPDDYYNFLRDMPLNDNTLLVSSEYSTFINRFEYCKPLSIRSKSFKQEAQTKDYSFRLEEWRLKDSVNQNVLGLKTNLTYEIAKIRSLKFSLNQLSKTSAYEYWDILKTEITTPFLIKTGNDFLLKTFPEKTVTSYELPQGAATDVFKKIIAPFKGKILFVDFWATSCAPCVGGIKRMKETREKYKDNLDFEFIFITDERSSPLETYNKMVKEQELINTFRISKDDFYYLRQLFKFNGIPHYAAIDKNGNVISDDFEMHNFENELTKILSNK